MDGLNNNMVNTVVEDRHGLIWIGTSHGLCYFDGANFKSFKPNPRDPTAIGGNEILPILEMPDGKLWIGSDGGGLSIFNPENQTFKSIYQNLNQPDKGLKENRVYGMHYDTLRQEIYIGYRAIGSGSGGISILSKSGEILGHHLDDIRDYAGFNMKVTQILQDALDPNIFWLAGRSFFRWNRSANAIQEFPHPNFKPNFTSINSIFQFSDSTLLIGLNFGGIQLFNTQHLIWDIVVYPDAVNRIKQAPDGKYWVADRKGVAWLDIPNQKLQYALNLKGENSPFPAGTYINTFLPTEESLWMATNKGLFYWHDLFQQFPVSQIQSPKQEPVFYPSFIKAIHPNTWLFMDRSEGLILTDSLLQWKKAISSLDEAVHRAFAYSEEGHVFLGGTKGLFQWRPGQRQLRSFPSIPNAPIALDSIDIWSLYMDNAQNKLWIGTRYDGLLRIDLKTRQLRQFLSDPKDTLSLCHNKYLFEIDRGPNGHLWICTDKGISTIDPNTESFVYHQPIQERINNYVIHCVEKDAQNGLWIGTRDQALFHFDLATNTLRQITTQDGLPYNGVNRLLQYGSKLWMSTREGFCKMDTKNGQITSYNRTTGLAMNNLYASKIRALPNEKLMLTYQYSPLFSVFSPDKLKDTVQAPSMLIQSLRTLKDNPGQTIYLLDQDTLRLAAKDNYFAIDFTGIHFLQRLGIHYEYRMEGYDEGWVNSGQNKTAIYTQLPGGNYTFKVRAKGQSQQWSAEQQLVILLATPWYLHYWFLGLVALLLAASIWLIYQMRIRQIRKETNFKHLLAETEIVALRAQINPHFIFNCLNSIKSYIIENEIKAGTLYVSRFAKLIRMILNHSREKQVPLSTELEIIELYLWLEQERLQHRFDFSINTNNLDQNTSIKVPPMLLQPFVENAIWHGLMNKEGKGHIQINIDQKDQILWMQIADDGVGRAFTEQLKQQSNMQKTSMGIAISKKRIEQLNTLYQMDAAIEIKDWKPAQSQPGTLVIIKLPISKVS